MRARLVEAPLNLFEQQKQILHYIIGATEDLPEGIRGTPYLTKKESLLIYREDYQARLRMALVAIYPATQRILGENIFEGIAAEYIQQTPSRHWDLNNYGDCFGTFIRNYNLDGGRCPSPTTKEFDSPDHGTKPPMLLLDLAAEMSDLEWHSHQLFHRADPTPLKRPEEGLEKLLPVLTLSPEFKLMRSQFHLPLIYRSQKESNQDWLPEWGRPSYFYLAKKNFLVELVEISPQTYQWLQKWQEVETLLALLESVDSEVHAINTPMAMTKDSHKAQRGEEPLTIDPLEFQNTLAQLQNYGLLQQKASAFLPSEDRT